MPSADLRIQQSGFTRFELALVALIFCMLLIVALNRIPELMVEAERVHLLQIEGTLKSALGLELARRVLLREPAAIADLAGSNPMKLIEKWPPNYLGERDQPDLEALPAGNWIFDRTRQVLIYTVRNTGRFRSNLPGRIRAEYRLELEYDDRNRNERFDHQLDRLTGFRLISVGDPHWLAGNE